MQCRKRYAAGDHVKRRAARRVLSPEMPTCTNPFEGGQSALSLHPSAILQGSVIPLSELERCFERYKNVRLVNFEGKTFKLDQLRSDCSAIGLVGQRAIEALEIHGFMNSAVVARIQKQIIAIEYVLQGRTDADVALLYDFAFLICRDNGKKHLDVGSAIRLWKQSLQSFALLPHLIEFLKTATVKVISKDKWEQIFWFIRTVSTDLSNYDANSAWPVLLDDFVASMKKQGLDPR